MRNNLIHKNGIETKSIEIWDYLDFDGNLYVTINRKVLAIIKDIRANGLDMLEYLDLQALTLQIGAFMDDVRTEPYIWHGVDFKK